MYLEKINSPADVKKLTVDEMTALAEEMRKALLFRLSKHGGHFGPNFGMVEATIAMHYVFESPKDKIVFDVSHQSYPHKILTGRKESYLDADKFDDISGYTNPEESEHDLFTVGHTSTSVSLASGLAKARDLKGEEGNVITLIGAIFLAVVAVLPIVLGNLTGMSIQLGGTSLLIVVGVALDTTRSLDSFMTMRSHKGFLG